MEQNKTISIVAYITVIGLVVAFILNQDKKDPLSSFHIRQSLGILITGVGISLLGIIPFLGWLMVIVGSLLVFIMWVFGLLSAINGEMKPVPVLGDKFEEWFQNVN